MRTFEIIATRGSSTLVISDKRPDIIDGEFRGYLYDRIGGILQEVGPEVFKFGYFMPMTTGTVSIDMESIRVQPPAVGVGGRDGQ